MKRVLIIGAGDLGQQIAHYVSESTEHTIVGYVDDWANAGDIRRGYPVLGYVEDTEMLYHQNVFDELLIGIGYKHFDARKQLFDRYKSVIPFATYIHQNCVVDRTAKIGKGVVMLSNCVVNLDAEIGDNVFLYNGCLIGFDSKICSHSFLSLSVIIGGHSHVGEKCFVGLGTKIIDNVTINDNNLIGAGSNVIQSITEPNGVYAGNPARLIRQK